MSAELRCINDVASGDSVNLGWTQIASRIEEGHILLSEPATGS